MRWYLVLLFGAVWVFSLKHFPGWQLRSIFTIVMLVLLLICVFLDGQIDYTKTAY
jgi:hypothetical protein